MKKIIFAILAFFVLVAVILPIYLGPDDLSRCLKPEEAGLCAKVDAIVAVSGGDTSARTAEAIRLYQAGWSELLIFSGAALDKSGLSNAEAMRRQAIEEGVDSHNIMIEDSSATTSENAENTAQLVEKTGIKRILLVTSAYHQRRASMEFKEAFGPAVEIVNHPVASDNQWSIWWWLTPMGWWLAVGEVVKIIVAVVG